MHSTANLTSACGLLFYFISLISLRFNLSNYSKAYYRTGIASLKIISASAFKVYILSLVKLI